MSGKEPSSYGNGPRARTPRSPSPWTPVQPSPPPIARRQFLPSSPMTLSGSGGGNGPIPAVRGNIKQPRPQWPTQLPQTLNQIPSPYQAPNYQTISNRRGYERRTRSSFQLSPTPSPSPIVMQGNDMFYGDGSSHYSPQQQQQQQQQQQHQTHFSYGQDQQSSGLYYYPPAKYEFVGAPLEPPQPKSYIIYDDENENYGPTTAEIIANQSQDYVDEKLAEYQMTILQLQEEQERVQKKTFTNWINSYLSKRIPPLRIDDLINDLCDGTKLIALLEVLSGERLPIEKGRVLRRPHFLSNANTALQFLASKRIKLVNINPADLVDGRPPVVLGLIWTIILYFQIEENSRNLEYLSHGICGSVSSLDSVGQIVGVDSRAEKWKQSARKTLLNWVTNALPRDSGVEVKDFGVSWRDGVAFLALIDGIKANLVNLTELRKNHIYNNRQRLETAFDVAENKLGIAKLLDAEDVDVPKPDEKSIMTYVAQFLHKYPEPKGSGSSKDFTHINQEVDELYQFLLEKTAEYEPMVANNSFPRDYGEYVLSRSEIDAHIPTYNHLKQFTDTQSKISGAGSLSRWQDIKLLWERVQYQMMYWLWLLDSDLPEEFGEVGRWLAEADKLILDRDIPSNMNEETAAFISRKLEEHKMFFADLQRYVALFEKVKHTHLAQQIPLEQLLNMEKRLQELPSQAKERRIRLKFWEHKCCLIAFLNLVENKMKGWTGKYGAEDKVVHQIEQYTNFVSRNKIFQEFEKAFVDMKQVVEEYKCEGNIERKEVNEIDCFMHDTEERWKCISMQLKYCQNSLEEVLNCWRIWLQLFPECEDWLGSAEQKLLTLSEDEKMEFFQDIRQWKDKFDALANAVQYLLASCEENIVQSLRPQYNNLSERFDRVFANTKKYIHAYNIVRARQESKSGIEKLSQWIHYAESVLNRKLKLDDIEEIKKYSEELQQLACEVDDKEEWFKTTSRDIQGVISDLPRDEVNAMMNSLKTEKEALIRVRAQIPTKLHLIHQLMIQQESLVAGQKEIHQWLHEAESILSEHNVLPDYERLNDELKKHKAFFSRTLYYRSMLESKNNVFNNLLKHVAQDPGIDVTQMKYNMKQLNERFNYVIENSQEWEQRFIRAANNWSQFIEHERTITEWLTTAEQMLIENKINSMEEIEKQKHFFEYIDNNLMQNLIESAQNLVRSLTIQDQNPILITVEGLQKRWQKVLSQVPQHLVKLEFYMDESIFYSILEDIEKELYLEQQALNRNEDVASILQRNEQYFSEPNRLHRMEKCLENMQRLSKANMTLQGSYSKAEKQWSEFSTKVSAIREKLQQIPAQWECYHEKFNEMVEWMDIVDKSLLNIVNEVNSMDEFEKEKVVFQRICQEADTKREDMKWLVKTLDHLLSYAAENDINLEQKKLESLIARYKSLIPTIEITMVKTEVFSKCYTYRREVHEVVNLLNKVKQQAISVPQPDSLDGVNKMVEEQQYAVNQLDHQRPHIMSMLQRGRDLSKDVHAPSFVQVEVNNLESGWNKAYGETTDKLQSLKSTQMVWHEFANQKSEIISILHQAETELRSITPLQTDPKNVSNDLKAKRDLNEQLQRASDTLIPKLQTLKSELTPLASAEKRPILEKEVTELEKMFFNTLEHVKDRVAYLSDYSTKWNNYKDRLTELQNWANKEAPKILETLHAEDLIPEERLIRINSFKTVLTERTKQLDVLASDAEELAPKEGNIAEAKRLKSEISKLQEVLNAISRNVNHQTQTMQDDLHNWQQLQTGLQYMRSAVEEGEIKKLLNEIKTERDAVEELNQACETLMENTACSQVRDQTIDTQAKYAALLTNAENLVAKIEKNMSHHTEFLNYTNDIRDWMEKAEHLLSTCTGEGNSAHITEHLDIVNSLCSSLPEGQQLFNLVQEAYTKASNALPKNKQDLLRDTMNDIRQNWENLGLAIKQRINDLQQKQNRSSEFLTNLEKLKKWLDQFDEQLKKIPPSNGELSEIKSQLERYKAHLNDIGIKGNELGNLAQEAKELKIDTEQLNNLQKKWENVQHRCRIQIDDLEREMNEYNDYYQALQDVEKWLLQISFQLMAHNSLCISNRHQTEEQIKQHESLLEEIQRYQVNIDELNAKGQGRIKRYESTTPDVRTNIENQLKNIQDSYNSLLQTSVQIRNRLNDSLSKFQEYEKILDNIMTNLLAYEGIIHNELDVPVENLEMAQRQLRCAQNLLGKVNHEKSRLSNAVQACETATASISRPSSPLESSMQIIPERELKVRSKLENVHDQVQSHIDSLMASVKELEHQQKQRNELIEWIHKQEDVVGDWMTRPCKLRAEAAKQELQNMNDLLTLIGDKRSQLMIDFSSSLAESDADLNSLINNLEGQLMDVIAKKQAGCNLIESYRQDVQSIQNWFDTLLKRMDTSDKGSGLTCIQKIAVITELKTEFDQQGPKKLQNLKIKATQVCDVISNLDAQQMEEQIKSLERRYVDLGKRFDRKLQLLDVTSNTIMAIKTEIEQLQNWQRDVQEQLQSPMQLGYTPKSAELRQQMVKNLMKEAECKLTIIDGLDKRISNLQPEIEVAEHAPLDAALRNLNVQQKNLSINFKTEMERALEGIKMRNALKDDLEKARNWLKAKLIEIKKLPDYHPPTVVEVENELQENKRIVDDTEHFKGTVLNDIQRQASIILKECPEKERDALQAILDEIENDYKTIQKECSKRANTLHDLLQGRQAFDNCRNELIDWLNEMETATEDDFRITSNLPVLEEQLAHYRKLLSSTDEAATLLNNLNEQAKGVIPTLSQPNKLKLNDELKILKERFAKIKNKLDDRSRTLDEHIRKHKDAKRELNDCIEFLNKIQQRLRELNKPIGSKIEDVQELLNAYDCILKQLKNNKQKMGEMKLDDLPELQSVLAQQDDMLKLIEDQLNHLRQLLLLREQFITLINDIIAFIMQYNDEVADIENSSLSLSEKINKYDDIMLKIQECEGLLASANDKGQKIASEGTTVDQNNITQQLQSLKAQLGNLKKIVEQHRQKHHNQLEQHKQILHDLGNILDELHNNEATVKSRPLLYRDSDSVEHELQKHQKLKDEIQQNINEFQKITKDIEPSNQISSSTIPSSIQEMLSEGRTLVKILPQELAAREAYLLENRTARLDYISLIAKLNNWLHEAEDHLQIGQHGVDYENLVRDLNNHREFFDKEEPQIRRLMHTDIQKSADKIWPSLNNCEQGELSAELNQYQTKLMNIITQAKAQQVNLEKELELWREYQQSVKRVKVIIESSEVIDESIQNLGNLHFVIQKLLNAVGNLQSQTADINRVNQQAQNLIRQADAKNSQQIEKDNAQLNNCWKENLEGLQLRRDNYQNIADKWDKFENRLLNWEKALTLYGEKFRNVDPIVRSRRHLENIKHAIQELHNEFDEIKLSYKDIELLSKTVITFLGEVHTPSAEAIQAKLDNLVKQQNQLNDSLQEKEQQVGRDLDDIVTIFNWISDLHEKFHTLLEKIHLVYVFDESTDNIHSILQQLSEDVETTVKETKDLIEDTTKTYLKKQNLIPSDITQEFTALELLSERVQGNMETKQKEFKRAKTVRTDYLAGVDDIQRWLTQAEVDVQNRAMPPLEMKEQLQRIHHELSGIFERFTTVKTNGHVIIENCRNSDEKLLVQTTIDQLSQQLSQIRSWLDEKKQNVNDSLDAWTRFMNLYQIVMAWANEQQSFIDQNIELHTLPEARNKSNDYQAAVKSIKPINKHLSEMDKELEYISQVATTGDLKDKLQEAEEVKVTIEAVLLQRNALLLEACEEWDQCERKIKEIRNWIEKTKQALESTQQKNKPLRDQLAYCEKTIADINVQKTKLSLSIEKLEVHFKNGMGGDPRLSENVDELLKILDDLNNIVKSKCSTLEETLGQIDNYQQQMLTLRQKIVQEEQQLRAIMAPTYLPHDRERAVTEQQACRERVKNLHSKITARNERIKLMIQRGTPDKQILEL